MWVIAGVLLGLLILVSLLGFHFGPHAHVVAGAVGVLAAAWLLWMAVDGRSAPLLWVLLSADVVVSAGVGTLAWKGLSAPQAPGPERPMLSLEGVEGVAVGDLEPNGIVRVKGESWSATAMNGKVRSGTLVQVLRVNGLRLEVWGDESLPADSERSAPPVSTSSHHLWTLNAAEVDEERRTK
jgi:membrane protein implicated in regulation of membrane protease activity